MLKTSFTLIKKTALTHDVFELVYYAPDLHREPPKPGQYVMFQLAPGLNRSYSISDFDEENFTLIIKKIPEGRGSPIICDAPIGTEFYGILPLGHFVLRETRNAKCFIGTGTGFAPLYAQIRHALAHDLLSNLAFVFGVKNLRDRIYSDEIHALFRDRENGGFFPYFSWEKQSESGSYGHVTDWITAENIAAYDEFYICGSPAMVKDARAKLASLGKTHEQIFFEQY